MEPQVKEFWSKVAQEWRSDVTGRFSAKFAVAGFVVTLAILLFAFPDRNGVILCTGLTAALFITAYLNAAYRVWEKENNKVVELSGQLEAIGLDRPFHYE